MRGLPLTGADRKAMLAAIGVESVDALYREVPEGAYHRAPFADLPGHLDEMTVEGVIGLLAASNRPASAGPCFLGGGAYHHYIPAAVDALIQRGEFLTAYTPYQPEISQGTLQAMFEFQTQVALLTGMDVANASLWDGATACAEAVLMATRQTRRRRVVLAGGLHPHWRDVVLTATRFLEIETVVVPADPAGGSDRPEALAGWLDDRTACVVVQNPDAFGHVRDLTPLAAACHAQGALLVAAVAEVVSLGLLPSPGEMGADIVVGDGQSLGNPLSFGGPSLGLFATRDAFVRQMPGRLSGATVDADGRRGYVLTLATREQHIRREKATSNICTNAGLCALAFSIHLALLGDTGLRHLARLNHARAVTLAERLTALPGVELLTPAFFNEFTLRLPKRTDRLVKRLAKRNDILAGVPALRLWPERSDFKRLLVVAVTETSTDPDMDALCAAIEEAL